MQFTRTAEPFVLSSYYNLIIKIIKKLKKPQRGTFAY